MKELKDLFQLDPDVVFLNHGSFGACPQPVFAAYQDWQRQLERQPVEFLDRRFGENMRFARHELARYVGTDGDRVVFVPNATFGLNLVARSLVKELGSGDDVLATDLEYGATDRMWRHILKGSGAEYTRVTTEFPLGDPDEFVDRIWSHVGSQTRVIFISHITSTTGLVLPIDKLISRARDSGIRTVVDGAHAPGQIELNLEELGVDFYAGNCHKWLMSPKGSAFLFARPSVQPLLEPLVVSWGDKSLSDSTFVRENEYRGTSDIAAYLSVPAAIEFQQTHNWGEVRASCRQMIRSVRTSLASLLGGLELADGDSWYAQMVAHEVNLPDPPGLQRQLYDRYHIEIPVSEQNGRWYLRASLQGYNDQDDIDAFESALENLLVESGDAE